MLNAALLRRIAKRFSDVAYGEDSWVQAHGDFREREARGLVVRPHSCYGMLRAADQAKYLGHRRVTILEFGVASGAGLLNMAELGKQITAETGIEFDIFGFDAGEGLPAVSGYKDHAELWMDGDFEMEDRDALVDRLGDEAQIIFGDIKDTIGGFTEQLSQESPIGFVSIDVDIYTATVSALRVFEADSQFYLPAVGMYLDDAGFYYANQWAGELLAIHEFNDRNELRKIDVDRSLPGRRPKPAEAWYQTMRVCHILDHDVRNSGIDREKLSIGAHHEFMRSRFLY